MSEFEKMYRRGDFDHLPAKRAADDLARVNRSISRVIHAHVAVEFWGVLVRVLPTAGIRARTRRAIARHETAMRALA